jgi:hypothetical protein
VRIFGESHAAVTAPWRAASWRIRRPDDLSCAGSGVLATLGTLPHPMGPQEFAAFLAKENARWSEAVKAAGVTVE